MIRRALWGMSVGLLYAAIFAVWLPLQMFALNQGEFTSGFSEFLPNLGCIAIALVAFASLISALSPEGWFQKFVAVALGIAFLVCIQSTMLVWDYGIFAGEGVEWEKFNREGMIDLAVWIGGILLSFFFSTRIWNGRKTLMAFLALFLGFNISSVFLSSALRMAPAQTPNKIDRAFQFSTESNVIAVLLDSFQTALFERIVSENPKYAETFKDFTFFRNVTSSFAATAGSLPSILSGQEYSNKEPYSEFLKNSFAPNALPVKLSPQGIHSTLVSLPQFCSNLGEYKGTCSSLRQMRFADRASLVKRETLTLMDLVLFRASPQILKRRIYSENEWCLERSFGEQDSKDLPPTHSNSLAFVDMFLKGASTGNPEPTFKFYHLFIPHAPQRLTADCEVSGPDMKRGERHTAQGTCALKLASQVLDKLKMLGVYERSLIVILADHGSGIHFEKGPRVKGGPPIDHARPLMIVKRPGEHRESFEVNTAPVALIDFAPTVLNFFKGSPQDSDLFSISRDAKRTRTYRHYRWNNPMWRREFFPPMTIYSVTGDVWDPSSWKQIE